MQISYLRQLFSDLLIISIGVKWFMCLYNLLKHLVIPQRIPPLVILSVTRYYNFAKYLEKPID